nr:IS5 family transposase [Mesorhizobium sp.]
MGRTRWRSSALRCRGARRKAGSTAASGGAALFLGHNITWRALPERFGKWNSVWKRFDRLNKAGVFETFFDHLAGLSSSAHLVQMFDSTVVRAHVSAAGAKRGQKDQALSRSRGGFSTKIHLKTDFDGHPIAFDLTGGEKRDAPYFSILLGLGPDVDPRAGIGDKGYASKANRQAARDPKKRRRNLSPRLGQKTKTSQ